MRRTRFTLLAFTLVLLLATVPGSSVLARASAPGAGQAPLAGPPVTEQRTVDITPTPPPDGAGHDAPVQAALAWLHTQQLPDGSFGYRGSGGSYAGNAAATADVVYVLTLLGENPAGPAWTVKSAGQSHSAFEALARLAPGYVGDDAGQAGKVARAVALAGGNPRAFAGLDLIGIMQRAYNPATGRYHPELLFRHTLAIEGLARAGEAVPPAAFDALLAARQPDGGWFWSFTEGQSDVDTTGRVLAVLADVGGMRCAPVLVPALTFLANRQNAAGGWSAGSPPGPANADSTGLAVAGLAAAGVDITAGPWVKSGLDPRQSLLAFQEPSGAFVYIRQPGHEEVRLAATIDTLSALASKAEAPHCNPFYLPVRLAQ